jgi:hypothetical protein
MTGPLARLAARALGAPAPMTGNSAAAIRPRLPARFETDAGDAPPPDEGVGPAGPILRRAQDPLPRTDDLRATDRSTPASPAPAVEQPPIFAPLRKLPHPLDVAPAYREAPSAPFSPEPMLVTATRPAIAAAQETVPVRPGPASAAPVVVGTPRAAPPPPSLAAAPTPPAPLQPLREPPPFRPTPVGSSRDLPPGNPPRVQPEPQPDIVIHIGRIDVAGPAAPPVAAPRPAPPKPNTTDLGDYLRGRGSRP